MHCDHDPGGYGDSGRSRGAEKASCWGGDTECRDRKPWPWGALQERGHSPVQGALKDQAAVPRTADRGFCQMWSE